MIKFIAGILFYAAAQPIIESSVELIQVMLERHKAKHALEITKMNKEMHDLQEPKEEEVTHVIGFHVPDQ